MSIDLLNRAFRSEIRPSSTKFVLVALADYANDWSEAYPSIETLCKRTSQDRKTVIANLQRLQQMGLIIDTGVRRGRTQQVRVYKILLKSAQDKNSTKNGTVPKTEQSPNSRETVPKTAHRSISEPPVFNTYWDFYPIKRNRAAAQRAWTQLPEGDRQAALENLAAFIRSLPDWQVMPYAHTYLLDRRWEDDLNPHPNTTKMKKTSTNMPWHHEALPSWASKNGYPAARPGESFSEYRQRLKTVINVKSN